MLLVHYETVAGQRTSAAVFNVAQEGSAFTLTCGHVSPTNSTILIWVIGSQMRPRGILKLSTEPKRDTVNTQFWLTSIFLKLLSSTLHIHFLDWRQFGVLEIITVITFNCDSVTREILNNSLSCSHTLRSDDMQYDQDGTQYTYCVIVANYSGPPLWQEPSSCRQPWGGDE